MAGFGEHELNVKPLLDEWPELAPDPAAMAQVTAFMMAAVPAEVQPVALSPLAMFPAGQHASALLVDDADEPGESHFRILTWAFAAVAIGGYWSWSWVVDWFWAHPTGALFIIFLGGLALLTPLVLLPVLHSQGLDTTVPE